MTEEYKAPKGKKTVSRIVFGKETEETEEIDVGIFETIPANVSVKAGATVNLHDYNSGRIDVMLSMPCYIEDIDETFINVKEWVDTRIGEEYRELKKVAGK